MATQPPGSPERDLQSTGSPERDLLARRGAESTRRDPTAVAVGRTTSPGRVVVKSSCEAAAPALRKQIAGEGFLCDCAVIAGEGSRKIRCVNPYQQDSRKISACDTSAALSTLMKEEEMLANFQNLEFAKDSLSVGCFCLTVGIFWILCKECRLVTEKGTFRRNLRKITLSWQKVDEQLELAEPQTVNSAATTSALEGDDTKCTSEVPAKKMRPYQQNRRGQWRKKRAAKRVDFMEALRNHSRWVEHVDIQRTDDPVCATCGDTIRGLICKDGQRRTLHWGCREMLENDVWPWEYRIDEQQVIRNDRHADKTHHDLCTDHTNFSRWSRRQRSQDPTTTVSGRDWDSKRKIAAPSERAPFKNSSTAQGGMHSGQISRDKGMVSFENMSNKRTFLPWIASKEIHIAMTRRQGTCDSESLLAYLNLKRHQVFPRGIQKLSRDCIEVKDAGAYVAGYRNKCLIAAITSFAHSRSQRQPWRRQLMERCQNDETIGGLCNVEGKSN